MTHAILPAEEVGVTQQEHTAKLNHAKKANNQEQKRLICWSKRQAFVLTFVSAADDRLALCGRIGCVDNGILSGARILRAKRECNLGPRDLAV